MLPVQVAAQCMLAMCIPSHIAGKHGGQAQPRRPGVRRMSADRGHMMGFLGSAQATSFSHTLLARMQGRRG